MKNNQFDINVSQLSKTKDLVNADAVNSDFTDEEFSSEGTIEEDSLDQALVEDDSDLDDNEKKLRNLNVKDFIKKEKRLTANEEKS